MAARVNGGGRGGFRIRVGVNTGRVVAGNIGGGGRLNFSVIGDPVNVAARTQAATRRTGDDVLITAETARHLDADLELEQRSGVILKGIDKPVTLYAPAVPDRAPAVGGDGLGEPLGIPGAVSARRSATL
jgi:adenylate cyclase